MNSGTEGIKTKKISMIDRVKPRSHNSWFSDGNLSYGGKGPCSVRERGGYVEGKMEASLGGSLCLCCSRNKTLIAISQV